MKRARSVKETSEKILKIGKNTIVVKARMVSDNCKKVTPANVLVDRANEKYSVTNDPLGNMWEIHRTKIITIGNESDTEDEDADEDKVEVFKAPSLIVKESEREQTSRLLDSLPSHSKTDSCCHFKPRIITVGNENDDKYEAESEPEPEPDNEDDQGNVVLPFVVRESDQSNVIDRLPKHSLMDSHCHIDFILDRRLSKLNLCTWSRLVQRYPALHHPALKGFIQNFCDPLK